MATERKMIDMTPTWAAIMPILFAGLENGTPDGKRIAKEELMRLAREMDKVIAKEKEAE